MPSKTPSVSFDLVAPVYDSLAKLVYGQAQQRAQRHFLAGIPAGSRVLLLGGGTGQVLTELLEATQPEHVLFLEASEKMLQKAKARLVKAAVPGKTAVAFRRGTEKDLLPQEKFHVVMTPFVLDLFTAPEARAMMLRLNTHLLPHGLWLHTDFREAQGWGHKVWQRPMLWMMYRFFGWVSHVSGKRLPPFDQLFQGLGLVLEAEAYFYRHFICAQKHRKPAAQNEGGTIS